MKNFKEYSSLIILIIFYLLCSLRYFPDNLAKTAVESLLQIFSAAPIPMGATILMVSFLQRTSGDKLPWDRILRIYLTVGIMVEFIFGIYHYLNLNS